jgi:superfamily II RNA helicase
MADSATYLAPAAPDAATSRPFAALGGRVPEGGTRDPDRILDLFLGWAGDAGFELYSAQEEALLELMAGRHVILNTPTGSGKSLVALGLHFKALCEGRTSYYTTPIKALASEKFFSLCDELGAERVGMLTGDAAINGRAAVRCCTAEVLANMALREGETLDAPYVVMDEFHYYSDPERGVAWQVPLITLPHSRFLLMSATLGNVAPIAERLEAESGREVAVVSSEERPVPLDYEYRETPLHETVDDLLAAGKAPVYVVSFTQRECAELAQSLTSMNVAPREHRERIWKAVGDFAFDTPYGKEMRRFIGFGVGVHHAGLLPKYRLLVEQLSQQGLLKVICGTDTLGVGVNIPIRTVLFSKLCKFDGEKTTILSVRDFKQIAGRAGRKGFDERGSVVCQAPEHVIENKRIDQKIAGGAKKKKLVKKKPPPRGFVGWSKETFENLVARPPETLESRFRLSHSMVLNLLQHDAAADDPDADNFASLRRIIARCHEADAVKAQLLGEAAALVRSLYRAGLIKVVRDSRTSYFWVAINEELQWDFSLFQTLSLWMVETLGELAPDSPTYALDLLSLVEAVLEDPRVILYRQVDLLKGQLVAQLKAEGMDYEDRMEKLAEVTHPKPNAELIYASFDRFREMHPWVGHENVRPKSIGREMVEGFYSFADYVRHLGLQRSEGVLLRYLSQLFKTLAQSVPEREKSEEVYDVQAYFRALIEHTDTSLLEEWESLLHPEWHWEKPADREADLAKLRAYELLHDPRAFAARVRAEMQQLVRALAAGDWEEAARWLRPSAEAPENPWSPERLEAALAPFLEEYGEIVFTPEARQARYTVIEKTGPRTWEVSQVLVDPQGDDLWHLEGHVDLTSGQVPEGPLVELRRVGV